MQKIYVSQYREYAFQLVQPQIEMINGVRIVKNNGKIIRFKGGQYITSDESEQKALEASPMYGSDFFDLLKQENEAKAAQAKSSKSLASIVEGARRTDTQIKAPVMPEPLVPPAGGEMGKPPVVDEPPKKKRAAKRKPKAK